VSGEHARHGHIDASQRGEPTTGSSEKFIVDIAQTALDNRIRAIDETFSYLPTLFKADTLQVIPVYGQIVQGETGRNRQSDIRRQSIERPL
jgi:hypothetical protein